MGAATTMSVQVTQRAGRIEGPRGEGGGGGGPSDDGGGAAGAERAERAKRGALQHDFYCGPHQRGGDSECLRKKRLIVGECQLRGAEG